MSYLLGFVTGIVILMVEKDDKFIRFHAMQSTVIFGILFLLNLVVGVILASLDLVAIMVNNVILILSLFVWIISIVRAFRGDVFKWPIVGEYAEKQVR